MHRSAWRRCESVRARRRIWSYGSCRSNAEELLFWPASRRLDIRSERPQGKLEIHDTGSSGMAGRPQKTYKHPVPSRNEILDYLTEAGRPQRTDAIQAAFGLKGQRMRSLLSDRLYAMVRAGQIIENRRHEYCLTQKLELVSGRVSENSSCVSGEPWISRITLLVARSSYACFREV